MYVTFSSPQHNKYFHLRVLFPIPLTFRIPTDDHAILIFSFLLQHFYDLLPQLKFTSRYNANVYHLIKPLNAELNPICYLLVLLGVHHFLHVSRIRVKLLTLRLLISYIYGAPILDVSRSHTTTQHSR